MPTTMSRRFVTVDVFTTTPFSGNPLAVVLDAEGLSTGQMQAVAREFNYVETTFILPPVDPAHTARVRIFTPNPATQMLAPLSCLPSRMRYSAERSATRFSSRKGRASYRSKFSASSVRWSARS